MKYWVKQRKTLFRVGGLKVVLGGIRAGQCAIVSTQSQRKAILIDELAHAIDLLVRDFNEGFRSTQGLPPDFMIAVIFNGAEIQYASYVPILNNWGFTEYVGLMESTPLILPWSYDQTAFQLSHHARPK